MTSHMKPGNLKHSFDAIIQSTGDRTQAAFIAIPFDVEEIYGTRGQVKVNATFDGHPYHGVIANMGTGCHIIGVRKEIRKVIGKSIGNKIKVTIQQDLSERTVELPPDFESDLKKDEKARLFFDALSYTNRKEYVVWISSAKKQETRIKRLKETIGKLLEGKKNPSEK